MKNLMAIIFFLLLTTVVSSSFADDKFPFKAGIVNMNQVYQKSSYFIGINDKFSQDFKPRQDALADMQKKFQDENAHLASMPSESPEEIDARDDMQQQVYIDKQNIDIANLELQRDATVAKYRMMKTFTARYNAVVKKLAQDQHYTIILQMEGNNINNSPIPYYDRTVDVTFDVIKALGNH